MSFVTPEFVLFFSIVLPIYFLLPLRLRWIALFFASYYFYASWHIEYLPLLMFTTIVDYFAGLWLSRTPAENSARRRLLLAASLGVNLGVLFIFKYFNFFNNSIADVATNMGMQYTPISLKVLLPVGISFYTFQSMSYTIDVFRGKLNPESNFIIFATYVAFFPQLVAGPIERATNLLPQFRMKFHFDYARAVGGLQLILWGAFKKIVIADRLAAYVNQVYSNPQTYSGATLIVATVFFAFQIYTDFSGYSDIAIGAAQVMGFSLMLNFRQPYFASSVREFWQRWHISLSTWFRDYLYFPLGGSRVPVSRLLLNLMIVFVVSGLWHGAAWTFVIWGFLHGLLMVVETVMRHRGINLLPRAIPAPIRTLISIGVTFVFVCIAWVFFRAQSFQEALYIIGHFFPLNAWRNLFEPFRVSPLGWRVEAVLSFGVIGILLFVDLIDARWGIHRVLSNSPRIVRWVAYYGVSSAIILISIIYVNRAEQFIYFQF